MGAKESGLSLVQGSDSKTVDPAEAYKRYDAAALEGFITPRWQSRKRIPVECIDFNRDGAGLVIDAPMFEKDDDVTVHLRVADKPELQMVSMPASVRYRIEWDGRFRIGLHFRSIKTLFRQEKVRTQACAIESYLAECAVVNRLKVVDGPEEPHSYAVNE